MVSLVPMLGEPKSWLPFGRAGTHPWGRLPKGKGSLVPDFPPPPSPAAEEVQCHPSAFSHAKFLHAPERAQLSDPGSSKPDPPNFA